MIAKLRHPKLEHFKSFLQSPFGIFTGVVGGILTGHFFPHFGEQLGTLGDVFISLMKMCIMPILLTSVSLSLVDFVVSKVDINGKKVAMVFLAFILGASALGMTVASITVPGRTIDTNASPVLRQAALQSAQTERSLDEPLKKKIDGGLLKFISKAVPQNVFSSITGDQYFQVLIFSVIFGFAMAFIGTRHRESLSHILESVRETFESIFKVITFLLPIAIFLILAKDLGEVGTETLLGMVEFILSMYLVFVIMFIINSVIISISSKTPYIKSLSYLKEPLTIAVITHSGIAAIPSAIHALVNNFKLDETKINLLSSMGLVVGQFGVIMYFSFSTIFIAQFYGIDLNIGSYIFILLMAGVASLSAIGAHGALIIPVMAIILDPLGLPLPAIMVLLVAVDAVIDPIRNLILVQTNCAILTITAKSTEVKN